MSTDEAKRLGDEVKSALGSNENMREKREGFSAIDRLVAMAQGVERAAARYRAIRQFGKGMKLYLLDVPDNFFSGDWVYNPAPEVVDKAADDWIGATSPQQPQPSEQVQAFSPEYVEFRQAEALAGAEQAPDVSAAGEPVAWVPRAKCDGETWIEGEFVWSQVTENKFESADPEKWEACPLFTKDQT